jgi:hypothetical protein
VGQTLQQKFDDLRAKDEAFRAALANLVDPATGEIIPVGESIFDTASKYLFSNSDGKLVRTRIKVVS